MEKVRIPAIQGKIGDTFYYTTNLTFNQIKEFVKKVDGELHTSTSIKEVIQRSLTDNYKKIRDYILNRSDFFFDSLVLAVYDGDPKWTEVRYEIGEDAYYNVGILEFTGDEKIFPVDGQHRVEGIKAALAENEALGSETIPVMLIGHKNTPEGRERSRRIFSTLNRYVKPVRMGDIIALDEDDIVAIVTRDLLEEYPLFMGNRIKMINNKAIPPSDKSAFTSLMTLYDCNYALYTSYMCEKKGGIVAKPIVDKSLKVRPTDDIIREFSNYLVDFWNLMQEYFAEIREFARSNAPDAARALRSEVNGGNLFFRPIGLLPFVGSVCRIKQDTQLRFTDILYRFSSMERIVSNEPWDKILWNPQTHKMVMRNQTLVKYLLIKMFDETILSNKEKNNMINRYAAVFNIETAEAENRLNDITL